MKCKVELLFSSSIEELSRMINSLYIIQVLQVTLLLNMISVCSTCGVFFEH